MNRIRITFDVSERVRRALNIFAARKGISVGDAIELLCENLIRDDLGLADKSIEEGEDFPVRRGRK